MSQGAHTNPTSRPPIFSKKNTSNSRKGNIEKWLTANVLPNKLQTKAK
jgi:hypothetical protein